MPLARPGFSFSKTLSLYLALALLLPALAKAQVLPQGNRVIGMSVDEAQNANYQAELDSAVALGTEVIHLAMFWNQVEPTSGQIGGPVWALWKFVDIVYPPQGLKVELQIAPINLGDEIFPTDLQGRSIDDPMVINRFKTLLDSLFSIIPNTEVYALNIGNEHDVWMNGSMTKANQYKTFLDSVSRYAKWRYAQDHPGANLSVGTTFTWGGMTNAGTKAACQSVNQITDHIACNYYGISSGFTVKPPQQIPQDVQSLINEYPDTSQKIIYAEFGYPSSQQCNSSEKRQSEFVRQLFSAWDAHADRIPYIGFFKSTDWSDSAAYSIGSNPPYNLADTTFIEYLRTLGLRTYPGSGANKEAFAVFKCEAAARGFIAAACDTLSVHLAPSQSDLPLSVWPNPFSQNLHLTPGQEAVPPFLFTVLNMQGQKVEQVRISSPGTFDWEPASPLPKGLYLYHLEDATGKKTSGKLIRN